MNCLITNQLVFRGCIDFPSTYNFRYRFFFWKICHMSFETFNFVHHFDKLFDHKNYPFQHAIKISFSYLGAD